MAARRSSDSRRHRWTFFPSLRRVAPLVLGMLIAPWLVGSKVREKPAGGGVRHAEDLVIVDCLLPAPLRRLGRYSQTLGPRRAIRTPAADCRIRGGEYSEDRGDYGFALQAWLPQAQTGDATAQTYVGEIFEKGGAGAPDYESAVIWYRKAAAQGHGRAAMNLGYLYEQGLGVAKDPQQALQWYRKASGLPDDMIALVGDDGAAAAALRQELERKQAEVERLRQQLEALQKEFASGQGQAAAQSGRETELRAALGRLERELEAARQTAGEDPDSAAGHEVPAGIEWGRYYALVVGNNDYREWPRLQTALNDARDLAALLERKYGFTEVRLLENVTRDTLIGALEDLREKLTSSDNLLVYYAGHGDLMKEQRKAFWIPIDGGLGRFGDWVSLDDVALHLDLMAAKHVLVVADSCFAGQMTRSGVARLRKGMSNQERVDSLRRLVARPARLVFTSGGVEPVLDGSGDGRHSVFARELLRVLEGNDEVLLGAELFDAVRSRVAAAAAGRDFEQVPEFSPIRHSKHGGGDFVLVPRVR